MIDFTEINFLYKTDYKDDKEASNEILSLEIEDKISLLKQKLNQIDSKSIRALRENNKNILDDLEKQASFIRQKLRNLQDGN